MAKDYAIGNQKKIAFPIAARYNYALKYFVEVGLEQQYIMQPRMTKKHWTSGASTARTRSVRRLRRLWAV